MTAATMQTEKALEKFSSAGSVRSGSQEHSVDGDESDNGEENEPGDQNESEAAHALAALTYASADGNGFDDDDDISNDASDGESSDEEDPASEVPANASSANSPTSDLQVLLKDIGNRPESFHAITVFQEPTTYKLYQPLDKSQLEGGIMDFGRWKYYTCSLVRNFHHTTCPIIFAYA